MKNHYLSFYQIERYLESFPRWANEINPVVQIYDLR